MRLISSHDGESKIVGHEAYTPSPIYIVAMNEDEYRALELCRLIVVEGGTTENYFYSLERGRIDQDLTNPLVAFREWMFQAGEANRLRKLADRLDAALKIKEEE